MGSCGRRNKSPYIIVCSLDLIFTYRDRIRDVLSVSHSVQDWYLQFDIQQGHLELTVNAVIILSHHFFCCAYVSHFHLPSATPNPFQAPASLRNADASIFPVVVPRKRARCLRGAPREWGGRQFVGQNQPFFRTKKHSVVDIHDVGGSGESEAGERLERSLRESGRSGHAETFGQSHPRGSYSGGRSFQSNVGGEEKTGKKDLHVVVLVDDTSLCGYSLCH